MKQDSNRRKCRDKCGIVMGKGLKGGEINKSRGNGAI